MNANQIGRPLKADELKPEMLVWTNPEHRPSLYASLWVEKVSDAMVWLYAGASVSPMYLGLFRQPDGSLKDDGGRTIRIFEYLGEV
jgi:hypothetical protein